MNIYSILLDSASALPLFKATWKEYIVEEDGKKDYPYIDDNEAYENMRNLYEIQLHVDMVAQINLYYTL